MHNDLIEKISSYLQEQNQPVPALTLAERFLKLQHTPPMAAEKIMTAILQQHQQFIQTETGGWTVNQSAGDNDFFSFVMCRIFPERTPTWRIQNISLATFIKDHLRDTHSFNVDYAADKLLELSAYLDDYIQSMPVIFNGFGNQRTNFSWLLSQAAPPPKIHSFFSLVRIIKKLAPDTHIADADDLSRFALGTYQTGTPEVEFNNFIKQVLKTVELLQQNGITNCACLRLFLAANMSPDFQHYDFDEDFIQTAPTSAGVYIMRNQAGEVIYVGKAKNIRRRLSTYFAAMDHLDDKLHNIRKEVYDIQLVQTGSELEALLLEFDYIQHYQPRYNEQVAVHIRQDYIKERYPQILFLPSAHENRIKVIFFHPAAYLKIRELLDDGTDVSEVERDIQSLFDVTADASEKAPNAKIEIVTSWLSRNSERVNSIDVRTVTSVQDALRRVHEHIIHFDANTKQIFL